MKRESGRDYLALARAVHKSGKKNCDGLRVPIWSDLNIRAWEKYVPSHGDGRLIDFLRYGFPLGLIDRSLNRTEVVNHHSAVAYPDAISNYIHKEIKLGAMLGPYEALPCGDCHVSPLMTRPKGEHDRRAIVDLSYGDVDSVNGQTPRSVYDGSPYTLTLPSLDYLIHDIMNTDRPKLIKVDIARAFRNLRINPGDALKLWVHHNNAYFMDKSLAFGAAHGTAISQRVTDAIRRIMAAEKMGIWNYIDDLFACVPEQEAETVFNRLCKLVTELGLPINEDKLVPPSDVMTCMGIEINANDKSIKIPNEKLKDISDIIQQFEGARVVSKQRVQSLLGKLLYVAKIVVPARTFLNRMLAHLRYAHSQTFVVLGPEFQRDIAWFRSLLHKFNNHVSFDMVHSNN